MYKAREVGSGRVVALKKVRCEAAEAESVRFMAREIAALRRVGSHPNVVRLEGIVVSRVSHSLYLVFEYMEHDLAGLAATPAVAFSEPQVISGSHTLSLFQSTYHWGKNTIDRTPREHC